MDKKKKNIILIFLLAVILLILVILVFLSFKNNKKMDNLIIGDNYNDSESLDNSSGNININEDSSNQNSNLYNSGTDNDVKNDASNENINNDYKENYTEEDVISYFDKMEKEVNDDSNWNSAKEKFKEYFITIVDFIFYDKEINGYTFSGITDTAKLKVVSVALKIDSKLEERLPGYKDGISNIGNKIYVNVKERLVTLYMDISTKICENNSNECAIAKEIFSDVKSACKIGWTFIKELTSSGFSKLKEWYEIYSGK